MSVAAQVAQASPLAAIFEQHRPRRVAHLAAMPGPRPSIANPALYEAILSHVTADKIREVETLEAAKGDDSPHR